MTTAGNFGERYLKEYAPLFGCAAVRAMIENIANTNVTALLRGEAGTGKDLVAEAIHAASTRCDGPFIKVNCAAIRGDLLEAELFGQEKGAFAAASRRKPGQFEYANKGTIYLDEIGEISLPLQAKLLHVLQDFRFSRVGGDGKIDTDVRVLAATTRDLELAIAHHEFREDLYDHLNAAVIRIPPLRERTAEIPILAERFLAKFNQQYGRAKRISPETMSALVEHSWDGNVRELEDAIRRMVVLTDGEPASTGFAEFRRNAPPDGTPPGPLSTDSPSGSNGTGPKPLACSRPAPRPQRQR